MFFTLARKLDWLFRSFTLSVRNRETSNDDFKRKHSNTFCVLISQVELGGHENGIEAVCSEGQGLVDGGENLSMWSIEVNIVMAKYTPPFYWSFQLVRVVKRPVILYIFAIGTGYMNLPNVRPLAIVFKFCCTDHFATKEIESAVEKLRNAWSELKVVGMIFDERWTLSSRLPCNIIWKSCNSHERLTCLENLVPC